VNFTQIFASLEAFETMKELHLDWACLNILSRMTWRRILLCVCVCVCVCVCERSNVSMKGKNLKVDENTCIGEIQGQSTLQPNSY
jgi:hypothetical protein